MVSDIDDAERLTDGGARSDDRDREETVRGTTGTGAIGGAIGIGALGAALGGPAGGIGGAVLGFILGEEFEKRTVPPHLRPQSRSSRSEKNASSKNAGVGRNCRERAVVVREVLDDAGAEPEAGRLVEVSVVHRQVPERGRPAVTARSVVEVR